MLRKFDFIFKKEKIRLYKSELLTKRIHYTITQIIQYESCKVKEKYPIKRDRVLFTRKKKDCSKQSLYNGFDPIEIDSRGHFIAFSLSRMNHIISKPRKSGKQERRRRKKKQDPFGKRWRAPERFVPLLPKEAAG